MTLLSKSTTVTWSTGNRVWYESKGYLFTDYRDEFEVRVEDLSKGSHALVDVKCDNADKTLKLRWRDYLTGIKPDGTYRCKNVSFEEWCINNGDHELLNRFNYELNNCTPDEILQSSNDKYWFNCPKLKHSPELKQINQFKSRVKARICKKCNSFAQWGIDNICENFLEKYWDYEKNNEFEIDPWDISYSSMKHVWLKCQEKDYHDSYFTRCDGFIRGSRCPYCSKNSGKIHQKDSFGQYILDNFGDDFIFDIWSDKNTEKPHAYSTNSTKEVWWKCPNNKHEDFKRSINYSNIFSFRCPKCAFSKGEKAIEDFLNAYKIKHIAQATYRDLINCEDALLGTNNGILSYDFYLPTYNILIEFQGAQHEKHIEGYYSEEKFLQQQEHDKRKRDYAKLNNIKLLEIWYYDLDRIEEILHNELIKK